MSQVQAFPKLGDKKLFEEEFYVFYVLFKLVISSFCNKFLPK